MKLAVVIPTYWKLDGSTSSHLTKALESIANQTHKDYKVFLIGDKYQDDSELVNVSKIIDPAKMYLKNLPIAVEREKYSGLDLWRTGGINATNTGIKEAINQGYSYVCHLDHDDLFFENHLELISACIESNDACNFISTKCGSYPPSTSNKKYEKFRPVGSKLFKSSTCMNYPHFNLFFRDVYEETGKHHAADADLWDRINKFMIENNEWGLIINEITCKRNGGGDARLKPEIVK